MSDSLVLIPGLQSDISSWLPLIERIGHHTALSVPMGHQFAPTIAQMAEMVIAQSPQSFHLVGWSMGGYIAFEMLRRVPERLKSLTLISTTAAPESDTARARRADALGRARSAGLREYQEENLALCLYDRTGVDQSRIEHLLSASEILGLDALETQTRAIMARPDSRPDLAACPCPVMIIVGRHDRIIAPSHAHDMHALRPDARFVEMDDCGHCPPLERPQEVAAMIRDWVRDASLCRTA